ncbi:hypothetical protein Hanom_Chr08g00702451 [Helianthus anomalus]
MVWNIFRLSSLEIWPSVIKMARFQTFWKKNKPLEESCKSGQTSGTKMTLCRLF